MEDYHSWASIIIFIILILLNSIFFAFNSSIKMLNEEKNIKYISDILEDQKKFKATLYIILILSSSISINLFFYYIVCPYKIVIYLALSIIFISLAMIVPSNIAKKYSNIIICKFYYFIKILIIIFLPLTYVINIISSLILKAFSITYDHECENVTEEGIINMVNEGHEQGVLESREATMINNIFELNDKKASDVMTNRKNLVCLDAASSLAQTVDFMLNEGINSRYPVYEDNIDNIIGIINMKDALIYLRQSKNRNKELKEIKGLIRKVEFILETKNLYELFKEMQENRWHLVVIIDEYSQTQGIVTLEDILEVIVGNILDEYDTEENNIIKSSENTYIISGSCSLDDFSTSLDFQFDEEDNENFDTINGFIINKLAHLPEDNEKFEIRYKNIIFKPLEIKNKFIESLKVIFI